MLKYSIGIIGLGKMGHSILNGVINSHLYEKKAILIAAHTHNEDFKRQGYDTTGNLVEVFNNCRYIFIAIKPQMFNDVFKDITINNQEAVIISVAAGISINKLEHFFGAHKFVRVMPNTPAMIGQGTSAFSVSNNCTRTDTQGVALILNSFGKAISIPESLMDAVIPLSGSMPAFLYLFVKDFVEKGKELGFDETTALNLVCSTIKGSIGMIETQNKTLDALIGDVSSKGGTTIAGLEALHNNNFDKAINECCEAAVKRSQELGK